MILKVGNTILYAPFSHVCVCVCVSVCVCVCNKLWVGGGGGAGWEDSCKSTHIRGEICSNDNFGGIL